MILTAGCSLTEQYHNKFPVWPHLLNKEVDNIGKSGTNNRDIAFSVLHHKGQYDHVLILWTHWMREVYFVENLSEEKLLHNIKQAKYFCREVDKNKIIKEQTRHTLMSIYTVQNYLNDKGISYYMMQGVPSFWNSSNIEPALEEINKFEHLIDTNKFYGWPTIIEVGGFNCVDNLKLRDHTISKDDQHPNLKGNQKIAEMFMKHANI
tara:strand:- start:1031 stop:1651 length:621 start_codon:yes stop_codon:yes gene_type:complete